MNRKNLKYIIGGVLVIIIVLAVFASISSDNITYYYTPKEALEIQNNLNSKKIRVMGLVEEGTVEWHPRETRLTFHISDGDGHGLPVAFVGAKPDMFREKQGVVVEGVLGANGVFTASTLLVKHSEEYKVKKDKTSKKDYYQSLD